MTSVSMRGLRGGVGSTSLLSAVGHALHSLGERVLLVDVCPENLLRLHFNLGWTERRGWARATLDGWPWEEQAWSLGSNLFLLPYGEVNEAEEAAMERRLAAEPALWRRRRASLAEHFDWLLFDLPHGHPAHAASVGPCDLPIRVVEADAACHVLLQRQPERSCDLMLVNRYDPLCQLQRDVLLLWQQRHGGRLLPVNVHADAAMREALACKAPVGHYAPASLVAKDALSVAIWCLAQRARAA